MKTKINDEQINVGTGGIDDGVITAEDISLANVSVAYIYLYGYWL